jgi:ubiquinone biosynthesis protein
MLQMVLEHGFFHADPHPGNIAVLPGNMIVFMDFGMVGYLPEHLQKHFFELVLGFLKYDTRQIIKTILAMGVVRGPVDIRAFKRDVDRLREQYTYLPLSQINFSRAVSELFELAFRYHIRIPTELTMLARAFLTVEGLLQELDPQLSLLGVAKPYGKKLLRQRLTWSGMKQGLSTTVLGYSGFLRDFPGQMHRVMQKITEDELSVTLEHRNLYLLTAGLNRAAQWLAWSIGLLALSILITGLMISSVVCGQSTITFLYWELPVLTTGFVVAFCLLVGLSFKLLGMCRKNRE